MLFGLLYQEAKSEMFIADGLVCNIKCDIPTGYVSLPLPQTYNQEECWLP